MQLVGNWSVAHDKGVVNLVERIALDGDRKTCDAFRFEVEQTSSGVVDTAQAFQSANMVHRQIWFDFDDMSGLVQPQPPRPFPY